MAPGEQAPLWDVHVHLPAYPDPEEVLLAAERRGMRLIAVTVSPKEARQLLSREPDPLVKRFIGVHPSEAESNPHGEAELADHWMAADGVGEVGLDPKYSDVSPTSAQMRLFKAQVEAAERLGKPLEVHSRDAEGECLDVLQGYSLRGLLLHWFQGEELLDRALSGSRTFVSFGPAILYSKKLLRVAARCPPEAVLVESDGPVPFAALGGSGGPSLVPSVAFKLAEVWGTTFEEALRRLSENAERFLE